MSVLDQIDRFGDYFDRPRIERPERIEKPVAGFSRPDLWPPDVWAEMQRIARGEDQ